jgi:hypothetical protein
LQTGHTVQVKFRQTLQATKPKEVDIGDRRAGDDTVRVIDGD